MSRGVEKWLVLGGLSAVYLLAFVLLYRALGPTAAAFALVPVAAAGWFFGAWAGILAGLTAFVANTLLLNVVAGASGWDAVFESGGGPGFAVSMVVGGVVGRLRDLNEQIKEAETRYRTLVEQMPAVTYVQEPSESGGTTYISPQYETVLGYPPEESLSDPEHRIRIMHPDDRERVLAEARRTDETGDPFGMEYRLLTRDGRVVWIRDEATLVDDEEGRPLYWLGLQMDITERKRAEEALRESELLLRTVITNVPVVLFALDREGVFTLSEGRGLDVLGLEPGEVVGRSVSDLYGDRPEILEGVDRALGGEEFSVVSEWAGLAFETWYSPLEAGTGEIFGVIGVAIDVTERKRAENSLRESEMRYRAVVEQTVEGIYLGDVETKRVLESNAAFRKMVGYTAEELRGMHVYRFVAHDPEDIDSVFESVLAEGQQFIGERKYRCKNGSLVDVETSATVVSYDGREVLCTVVRDVSERKGFEEALRQSEERFRSLVQNASDVITIFDTDGTIHYVTPSVERVLGYQPEELIGDSIFGYVHPDDLEQASSIFAEVLDKPGVHPTIEFRLPHADESWRYLEHVVSNLLDDPSVNGIVVNSRDITERKRAEEEMKEANRRLEEIAALRTDFTAMVAHELGSPLATVRGFLDVLATGELGPAEQTDALAKIGAEIEKLSILVADVRSAAAIERDEFALMPRRTWVSELLDDAVRFAKTIPGDHPLTVKTVAETQVRVDPYRIGQVLRNLLSNAAKYSPDGAPVELRAILGETPGRVSIEVADRGYGIHYDDVDRIFEKFGRGRDRTGRKAYGVGLGLYLSRRIVQAHGGELTFRPAAGGGSVFSFDLEADR